MAKQETSRRKIEYGGKPALTDEANRIGNIEARKGITISTLNDELPEVLEIKNPNSSGRPPKNIFQEKKKRGGTCQFRDLADARNYVVNQHRLWQNTYKEETTSINIPAHRCRLPSRQFRNVERPIWTVWRAGEYCEILAGRNWPEERADRRGYNAQVEPLANECRWFWSWLNVAYEYQSMIAPGKKRNAEQHFKAALSAFLTRRYLLPKGGNRKVKISPTFVSQMWFAIFGEYKDPHIIKKLLPELIEPCLKFPSYFPRYQWAEPERFKSLGKTLRYNYPSK